ncbi:MAG: hypothetical protein Q8L68_00870 [Methylococcales bacterium]|nr:hypothetical protein [Methylococcales bacterium]
MGRINLATQTTPATPSAGTAEIYVDSADKTAKLIDETGAVKKMIAGISYSLPAAVATSGTGETLLFKLDVPANLVAIGHTFWVTVFGVSSSTGTLIFRVRVGANGTIADNQAWISATSVAQVANAWASVNGLLVVRSIGTGTVQGTGGALAGAVVLPQLIGAAATAAVATSAIWYIDVCCTCSVGTFTAHSGTIEQVL